MNTPTKTNGGWRSRNLFPGTLIPTDFFNLTWPGFDFFNGNDQSWVPAANLTETEQSFAVELSVPGFLKRDISVHVENKILTISGTHKIEKSKEKKNYTRQEFRSDSFTRSFELPDNVSEANISAKYNEGLLTIELPKSKATSSKKKTTEIAVQ